MFRFDKNRIQFITIKNLIKVVERNSQNLNLSPVISEQGIITWLYGKFLNDVHQERNTPPDFLWIECSYCNPVDIFITDENNDAKLIHGISIIRVLSTMILNKYEFYGKGYDRISFIQRELEEFFKYKNIHLNFNVNDCQLNSIDSNQNEQAREMERLKNENERLKNEYKKLENENRELKKGLSEKTKFISSLRLNELADDDPLAVAIDIRRREWGGYIPTDKATKPKNVAIIARLKANGCSNYLAGVIERVACPIAR